MFFWVLLLAFIRSFILSLLFSLIHVLLSFLLSFIPFYFYKINTLPRCFKWACESDCRGSPKHLKMCILAPRHLHSAFMDAYGYCCWSVCPSICPFVRLRHYWEMAVAITCGYGGYLLPLLAAHSSYMYAFINITCVMNFLSEQAVNILWIRLSFCHKNICLVKWCNRLWIHQRNTSELDIILTYGMKINCLVNYLYMDSFEA